MKRIEVVGDRETESGNLFRGPNSRGLIEAAYGSSRSNRGFSRFRGPNSRGLIEATAGRLYPPEIGYSFRGPNSRGLIEASPFSARAFLLSDLPRPKQPRPH